MADAKDLALLLAEGETAKAKALREWLDQEPAAGPMEARVVIWRTYFAHMAAAERYLELANHSGVKTCGTCEGYGGVMKDGGGCRECGRTSGVALPREPDQKGGL